MGSDQRPIDEIISEDLRVLEQHHISKETIVDALDNVYNLAQKAFGVDVMIRDGVTAVFHESMGRIPSPFQGDGVFEKGEVVVKDAETGHVMTITRLGIHLINKHSFFQGVGSPYRIDPERAISILGLTSM